MNLLAVVALLSGALTNGVDVVVSERLPEVAAGEAAKIEFVTDWPADVLWFGAYLRKGKDRYAVHPEPFVPGSYFEPGAADADGKTHFFFVVKPAFVKGALPLVRFRARHAPNPAAPDAAAIDALGKKAHPRLVLRPGDDVFARIKAATATNEVLAAAVAHLKAFADKTLEEEPVAYSLDGRRLWSQPCTARTLGLAQAWKIFGDRRYLDRLERELKVVAAYPDWNPSHFIDTALFAFDLAVAYDWLYDDWSAETRDLIANALVDKALKAADPKAFWIHNGNNWSQVCLCGMLAASIAVAERVPDLARRHIGDAVSFLHEPAEAYAPNGGFPEGPGYWNLATTYQVLAIECMRSAFGTDFGLVSEPGFQATAEFPDLMTGPSGFLFSHSDCGKVRSPLAPLWWFAREFGRPDVTTVERRIDLVSYGRRPGEALPGRRPHSCESCFIPLVWMVDVPQAEKSRLPKNWWSGGSVPVIIQTTSHDDPDALWVGTKGGTAEASHAHADQGSFILDALGERWAEDVGGESYGIGESAYGMKFWDSSNDSPRWSYFRLGPQGHNVVTIDGEKANVVGFAPLHNARCRGNVVICDLTAVHPAATRATRMGELAQGGYTITDRYHGVKEGTTLVWRMNTYAKPTIDKRRVILEKNGKRLSIAATAGSWSVHVPELPKENPDKDLMQLQLRVTAGAGDVAAWSVRFVPLRGE